MHGRLLAIGLAMMILIGCNLSAAQQQQTALPTQAPAAKQAAPTQGPGSSAQPAEKAPAAASAPTQAPGSTGGGQPQTQPGQGNQPLPQRERPTVAPLPANANAGALAAQDRGDLTLLYKRTAPSVVYIAVRVAQGISQGSGFIIDRQGYIVTNNHVVAGADAVRVEFFDKSAAEAEVVGVDPDSDLAVLKVQALPDAALVAPLADSDTTQVGERVVAIGNPFGREFAYTMTEGIVSALGRSLPAGEEGRVGAGFTNPGIIQTDAAVNRGNSGGPLFNMKGEVIGVNTAIQSPSGASAGLAFAVPSNTVRRIAPEIIQKGFYSHAYLGVSVGTATTRNNKGLEIPVGAILDAITRGGPAERGGLRQGDVITAIGDRQVFDRDDLLAFLEATARPGQTVSFKVLRGGREQTVNVTVGERPRQR